MACTCLVAHIEEVGTVFCQCIQPLLQVDTAAAEFDIAAAEFDTAAVEFDTAVAESVEREQIERASRIDRSSTLP